jgi:hypothetical protein
MTTLAELSKNGRVITERAEIIPPNSWSVYGINSPSGQDTLAPLSSARYMNLINKSVLNDGILTRFVELENAKSPLINTLNVSHWVAINRDEKESIPAVTGRPFPWLVPEGFVEVANISSVRLYSNPNNLGESWIPKKIVCQKDPNLIAQELVKPEYEPQNEVYVNCDVEAKYKIFSKTSFPGWLAKVDGKKTEIKSANIALMAVEIPNDQSKVELSYFPQSVKAGSLVTLGTLFLWGGVFFIKTKWAKN